jgi:hypothetical protein
VVPKEGIVNESIDDSGGIDHLRSDDRITRYRRALCQETAKLQEKNIKLEKAVEQLIAKDKTTWKCFSR